MFEITIVGGMEGDNLLGVPTFLSGIEGSPRFYTTGDYEHLQHSFTFHFQAFYVFLGFVGSLFGF